MKVGVAEAVDGLLRIADEERRQMTFGVDAVEDGKLQRIGVLEFVDQRHREPAAQRPASCG